MFDFLYTLDILYIVYKKQKNQDVTTSNDRLPPRRTVGKAQISNGIYKKNVQMVGFDFFRRHHSFLYV